MNTLRLLKVMGSAWICIGEAYPGGARRALVELADATALARNAALLRFLRQPEDAE